MEAKLEEVKGGTGWDRDQFKYIGAKREAIEDEIEALRQEIETGERPAPKPKNEPGWEIERVRPPFSTREAHPEAEPGPGEILTKDGEIIKKGVTDLDAIRKLSQSGPARPLGALYGAPLDYRYANPVLLPPLPGQETIDNVLERAIGGFAFNLARGRYQTPFEMHCCTANGNQGFYYAWDAVVKGAGDEATINLLFNRFSPWLDLLSYLPYEGKAVIRNKKARKLHIRIPGWVKQNGLRCSINGEYFEPSWSGRMINLYDVPLNRLRYVFWNPIKHGLAENPEDYSFSNYKAFLLNRQMDFSFSDMDEVSDVPEF